MPEDTGQLCEVLSMFCIANIPPPQELHLGSSKLRVLADALWREIVVINTNISNKMLGNKLCCYSMHRGIKIIHRNLSILWSSKSMLIYDLILQTPKRRGRVDFRIQICGEHCELWRTEGEHLRAGQVFLCLSSKRVFSLMYPVWTSTFLLLLVSQFCSSHRTQETICSSLENSNLQFLLYKTPIYSLMENI